MNFPAPQSLLKRPILFVGGKGGVGKSTLARVLARGFARSNRSTLLVSFESEGSTAPSPEPHLDILHCDVFEIFGEYARSKLRIPKLANLLLHNQLVQYLIKAAPGVPDLLRLGKIWSERKRFDKIIVDLPSTGYSIALFQSLHNFLKLFHGGPLQRETQTLLSFFSDPSQAGLLVLALPEEMPIQEALEHAEQLERVLPSNPPAFIVNRCLPPAQSSPTTPPVQTLLASSSEHYIALRRLSEAQQIQESFEKLKIPYERFFWEIEPIEENLLQEITNRGWFDES